MNLVLLALTCMEDPTVGISHMWVSCVGPIIQQFSYPFYKEEIFFHCPSIILLLILASSPINPSYMGNIDN